jgi:hypothetical protein
MYEVKRNAPTLTQIIDLTSAGMLTCLPEISVTVFRPAAGTAESGAVREQPAIIRYKEVQRMMLFFIGFLPKSLFRIPPCRL